MSKFFALPKLGADTPSESHRAVVFVAVSTLLFGLVGCGENAEGTIVSTGEPLGDFSLELNRCTSGEHRQFFGVYLIPASGDGGMTLIRDVANGDLAKLEIPGSCGESGTTCRVVDIKPQQCSRFDAVLEQGSTRVNLIWELYGSLDLECEFGSGSLEAHIKFDSCT